MNTSSVLQTEAQREWSQFESPVFSMTPPTKPGFYWIKWAHHANTIGQFTGKHWWMIMIARKVETEELVNSGYYQFGPRIPGIDALDEDVAKDPPPTTPTPPRPSV